MHFEVEPALCTIHYAVYDNHRSELSHKCVSPDLFPNVLPAWRDPNFYPSLPILSDAIEYDKKPIKFVLSLQTKRFLNPDPGHVEPIMEVSVVASK